MRPLAQPVPEPPTPEQPALACAGVRLEPLAPAHLPALLKIALATPEVFRYTSTPRSEAEADAYFGRAFTERAAGRALPYAVLAGSDVVGTTRLAALNVEHRNAELGYTWLAPRAQGGGVNAASKYLLLSYAFETLDLLRVYFYADARNARSQRAILKLGAVCEGTLRAERVTRDGHVRDTVVYSLLWLEWPARKAQLEARLGGAT